jgi:hypothetical protein
MDLINSNSSNNEEPNTLDGVLDRENTNNKSNGWNKLSKTDRMQLLHCFAEKYGKVNGLPAKEVKSLKLYFNDCLEKQKLQKTKDVIYDKNTREITSIPGLFFNATTKAFTLKINDPKRVSTLKSLTPKRTPITVADNSNTAV